MTFQGQQRGGQYEGEDKKRILHLFEGFQCEVQCKASDLPSLNLTQASGNTSTTTTVPPLSLSTLNATIAPKVETKPVHTTSVR